MTRPGTTAAPVTILDALDDPALFGQLFAPRESWAAWRTFLATLFGLPMSAADLERYRQHTGRKAPPTAPAREGWAIVGRRGGKSRIAALVAVYLAAFRDHARYLAPGERGVVMALAADRKQARVVLRYIRGLLEQPILAGMVAAVRQEAIDLENGISLEVHTSSYRSVRGYTIVGAICDELAFWRSEDSASPDVEVLNAIRPGMATVPGALLLGISSPHARRGELWNAYKAHHGNDGDSVLTWNADTLAMNPGVDPAIVATAYEADPAAAAAEYGALFRSDLEAFVTREALEHVVVSGRLELPPVAGVAYRMFLDPAGGSGRDSMSAAIAHVEERDGRRVAVLDAVRERKPAFSPAEVVTEFSALAHAYGCTRATSDRYAGSWPTEAFAAHGVTVVPCDRTKSELYGECLPALNSRSLELLDLPRLAAQILGLERRAVRGGRDLIDHGPSGHDDVCNAALGALWLASSGRRSAAGEVIMVSDYRPRAGTAPTAEDDVREAEAARVRRRNQRRIQQLVWGDLRANAHPHERQ